MKPKTLAKFADQFALLVKEHVAAKLAPISTRLATQETRCAALSMLIAKGQAGKPGELEDLEDLLQRVRALEQK